MLGETSLKFTLFKLIYIVRMTKNQTSSVLKYSLAMHQVGTKWIAQTTKWLV